jgi:hypothetical protein
MFKYLLVCLSIILITSKTPECGPFAHLIQDMDSCSCDIGYHSYKSECLPIKDLYFDNSACLQIPSVNISRSILIFDINFIPINAQRSTFLRKEGVFEFTIVDFWTVEFTFFLEDGPVISCLNVLAFQDFQNIFRITIDFAQGRIELMTSYSINLPEVGFINNISSLIWNENHFEMCVGSIRKLTIWEESVPWSYSFIDM